MSDASPQVENGYTKIANELLDAVLQFGFSKRQMAVLFAIVRKTYGFNKREDDMTVTQLAQVSGLARQNASTALSELEAIGAVSKRDGQYGYVLKINKNYQQWGASNRDASKQCASKRDGGRIKARRSASQNDAEGVSKRCTQKTTPKDNSKRQSPKEMADTSASADTDGPTAEEMFDAWYAEYPKKVGKQQAWKAWKRIKPGAELGRAMIVAVRRQKKWRDQTAAADPSAFIPEWKNPATWLNAGSWEDELEQPKRISEQRRSASDFLMTEFD